MRQRKILLPAFSAGHGRSSPTRSRRSPSARIARWPVGRSCELQDEMEAISFESIMSVVFGADDAAALERLRS